MTSEIEDIFSIFHDGGITEWKGDLKQLTLKIECQYLGKEFQDDFENFYLIINGIELIEFEPWISSTSSETIIKTELAEIFEAELEIGYAETINGGVKITCNQHDTNYGFYGGNLFIKAEIIEIQNHLKQNLPLTDLYKASENYWNKFSDE